uniref:Myb-like domain-containing protein n=1 Tax=Kalanchoe fedtschenkoi TaxID=63787 RepID=A0A7N0T9D9_KALFE
MLEASSLSAPAAAQGLLVVDGAEEENAKGGGIDNQVMGVLDEDERVREFEEHDRNFAGNRWPHDETLALIKVRSDMDAAFRESSAKGPLWDEVSRKLAALGFNRSSKKCKEKFENIYKYYRRTKELGQRPNGKTYRFFEQLEAIDHYPQPLTAISPSVMNQLESADRSLWIPDTTVAINVDPLNVCVNAGVECQVQNAGNNSGNGNNYAMNSSTWTNSRSKESEGMSRKAKKKRKFLEFFDRLMMEVTVKQEELQRRCVEAIERYEFDRIKREEAWRVQEMARIRREHEMLAHERSIAAAKDAAVIALLQKFSQQEIPVQFTENNPITVAPKEKSLKEVEKNTADVDKPDAVLQNSSSSRWPRAEVEALISVRSTFDMHCQENGPKGPLWEEISAAMKKRGYDRSAKRCKEKWENINKYFKRVRDSNKKRPEDSRTCPYFHLLDNLYKQKAGNNINAKIDGDSNVTSSGENMNSSNLLAPPVSYDMGQQQNELARMVGSNMDPNLDESADNEEEEEEEASEDGENYRVMMNSNQMAIVE